MKPNVISSKQTSMGPIELVDWLRDKFLFALCLVWSVALLYFYIDYYNNMEIDYLKYKNLSNQVYLQSDNKEFMDYLHKANEDGFISIGEFDDLKGIAHAYNRALYLERSKSSLNEAVGRAVKK